MEPSIVDEKKIGVRISDRRRALGLRQAEVNEVIGFSDKYLSHVESGKVIPSLDALLKICKALHTTPDILLLGATRNESDDELISQKVKMITGKKKIELLSQFIDWLTEQDL